MAAKTPAWAALVKMTDEDVEILNQLAPEASGLLAQMAELVLYFAEEADLDTLNDQDRELIGQLGRADRLSVSFVARKRGDTK